MGPRVCRLGWWQLPGPTVAKGTKAALSGHVNFQKNLRRYVLKLLLTAITTDFLTFPARPDKGNRLGLEL